jgi:hypothetical protein
MFFNDYKIAEISWVRGGGIFPDYLLTKNKWKSLISLGKMISSRRPRAVERTAMRLGGNGMEEKFSSYLYDEWA